MSIDAPAAAIPLHPEVIASSSWQALTPRAANMHALIAALTFSVLLHCLAALSRWQIEPAAAIPNAALVDFFGQAPTPTAQAEQAPALQISLVSPNTPSSASAKSVAVISAISATSKPRPLQANEVQKVLVYKPQLPRIAPVETTPVAPKTPLDSRAPTAETIQSAPATASTPQQLTAIEPVDTSDPATVALEISAWLQGFLRYPRAAQRAGVEGRVLLRFKLHADGSVSALTIQASSGAAILDNAALRLVKQAQPLPTPAGWKSDAIEIEVPVDFELQRLSTAGAQRRWR